MIDSRPHRSVPRARFSVEHLPEKDRFQAWTDSLSCIFETDRTRTLKATTDFRGSVSVTMIGSMLLAETVTITQIWNRSPRLIARDGMDHYMIQIYLDGGQLCESEGRSVDMPRGGALVYDLSRPVKARSSDLRNLSLVLPRAMVENRLSDPDAHHLQVLSASDSMSALLIDHIKTMNRHAGRLDGRQTGALTEATLMLAAAALNVSGNGEAAGTIEAHDQLVRIRADIRARVGDMALSPGDLCRRHNVSRHRLYALFASQGGVATAIREARLQAARARLSDPAAGSRRVSDIAQACGFSSDSDFSRAFRQRFGMSPSAARHYGLETRAGMPGPGLDRRYEAWLHQLAG